MTQNLDFPSTYFLFTIYNGEENSHRLKKQYKMKQADMSESLQLYFFLVNNSKRINTIFEQGNICKEKSLITRYVSNMC
jgi:hypothetical protein